MVDTIIAYSNLPRALHKYEQVRHLSLRGLCARPVPNVIPADSWPNDGRTLYSREWNHAPQHHEYVTPIVERKPL